MANNNSSDIIGNVLFPKDGKSDQLTLNTYYDACRKLNNLPGSYNPILTFLFFYDQLKIFWVILCIWFLFQKSTLDIR